MKKNYYTTALHCAARVLLMATVLLATQRAAAYDFKYNGLCYNVNADGTTATLTCETEPDWDDWDYNTPTYASLSGAIDIPATVRRGSKPLTVTAIGRYAFWLCKDITSVTIPASVTTIEPYAFQSCSGLTQANLSEGLVTIEGGAFSGTGLTEVTIPSTVKKLAGAFSGCNSLTRVNVIDLAAWCDIDFGLNGFENPLYEAHHLYMDGIEITSLFIPEGVKTIKRGAFAYGTGLQAVRIPASVTSIDRSAFEGCTGLNAMVVSAANKVYDSRSSCNAIVETATSKMILGCGGSTFPSGIKSIGYHAFYGCKSLTTVALPASVVEVEDWAFANCSAVTSVTFSEGLKRIGAYAFTGNGITEVSIPVSVEEIGDRAFNCSNLATIDLPNDMVVLGNEVFYQTAWLKAQTDAVVYIGNIAYKCIAGNGEVALKYGTTNIAGGAFSQRNNVKTVNIPSTVRVIGPWAFSYSGLTAITIPGGVTTLRTCTFQNCNALTSVTLHNAVTTIEDFVFRGCGRLASISIPNSVTSIGRSAFSGSALTNIYIPASVTEIGESAFACVLLESMSVNAANKVYDSREGCSAIIETATNTLVAGCKSTEIPVSVTAIGNHAFYNSGLTSITIPGSVKTIGEWAFNDNSRLTEVTMEEGVVTIDVCAFQNCAALKQVSIPSTVKKLCDYAFVECSALERIDAYPNPAKVELGEQVFEEVPKEGTLHVLPAYREAYKSADQWRDFTKIVPDLHMDLRGDVNGDSEVGVPDLTKLVDLVLRKTNNERSDVNGDHETSIADISALIDIILGKD